MTSILSIGATLGEAVVPFCVGEALVFIGPISLPIIILVSTVILILIYFSVHLISNNYLASRNQKVRISSSDSSVENILQCHSSGDESI